MDPNRRKFIATTTLSLIGISLSNSLFAQTFDSGNSVVHSETRAQMLRNAAIKRRNGEFGLAREMYTQIITAYPAEVRAYDGIRKIMLQEKYKELEVFNLYLDGFNRNPGNPIFKERLAKEYMRLALGNKKFSDQLTVSEGVLDKAKYYFEEAMTNAPNNEQFQKQLEKAEQKMLFEAESVDARENAAIKNKKKEDCIKHKNRFAGLTASETKEKLDKLLTKSADDYRNVHIRELYRTYIKKLKDEGNFDLAANYTRELYMFDKKDSLSLKIARNVCKKDKKYEVLEAVERKNESIKKSFWSKIALFDVLYLRYKHEGVGSLTEMKNILNGASAKKYSFYHIFEYNTRVIRLSLIKNNYTEALTYLNTFADSMVGTSSAHFIDKFSVLCTEYYLKRNDLQNALDVLNIGLQEKVEADEAFLQKLIAVNSEKKIIKKIHVERLNDYRIKLLNGSY
ncbi:MAG: hypothetical protein QM710_06390 [Flavobacterium sp.]